MHHKDTCVESENNLASCTMCKCRCVHNRVTCVESEDNLASYTVCKCRCVHPRDTCMESEDNLVCGLCPPTCLRWGSPIVHLSVCHTSWSKVLEVLLSLLPILPQDYRHVLPHPISCEFWRFELRSSHLLSKCFTYRANSPALAIHSSPHIYSR